ncbi:uncharacterized protein N7477_007286 [Penicillium maclennaniae]|uniref:uncharacterized protein n=1 Tax=Penicillium maclennaniae TaxID=1343394 RepID=UPI00254045AB|nr:uncharacterized protein N7477_007286 [Penicillium maclennaniae]KAJ5664838.1 hypothetical protein N7477_007286 [Penicillium maclennaniae]
MFGTLQSDLASPITLSSKNKSDLAAEIHRDFAELAVGLSDAALSETGCYHLPDRVYGDQTYQPTSLGPHLGANGPHVDLKCCRMVARLLTNRGLTKLCILEAGQVSDKVSS